MSGDNNICPSCGERFRSVRGFDAHRTGEYGAMQAGAYRPAQRRCKSVEEMKAAGMQRNGRGLWITRAFGLPLHSGIAAADARRTGEYEGSAPEPVPASHA